MPSSEWTAVLEDLEALCTAWRLLAAGEEDVEVAVLPDIPTGSAPPSLQPRLRTVLAEFDRLAGELAQARDDAQEALSELRLVSVAADRYLRN